MEDTSPLVKINLVITQHQHAVLMEALADAEEEAESATRAATDEKTEDQLAEFALTVHRLSELFDQQLIINRNKQWT